MNWKIKQPGNLYMNITMTRIVTGWKTLENITALSNKKKPNGVSCNNVLTFLSSFTCTVNKGESHLFLESGGSKRMMSASIL